MALDWLLFFWPQGVAVIELAHRCPGEGGVYLWAKQVFGDFHGFLSGRCFGGSLFFVGLAAFFFFVYGRRKAPQEIVSRAV